MGQPCALGVTAVTNEYCLKPFLFVHCVALSGAEHFREDVTSWLVDAAALTFSRLLCASVTNASSSARVSPRKKTSAKAECVSHMPVCCSQELQSAEYESCSPRIS